MDRRVAAILMVVNGIGLFAFAGMWLHAAWFVPLASDMRVTELDRAQVFDMPKLAAFDPELAGNVRHKLADWIMADEQRASVFNAIAGLLACALNLAVLIAGRLLATQQSGGRHSLSSTHSR